MLTVQLQVFPLIFQLISDLSISPGHLTTTALQHLTVYKRWTENLNLHSLRCFFSANFSITPQLLYLLLSFVEHLLKTQFKVSPTAG